MTSSTGGWATRERYERTHAGVSVRDGHVTANPAPPAQWTRLAFPLIIHGQPHPVEINHVPGSAPSVRVHADGPARRPPAALPTSPGGT